jgi:hypothetical protein
VPPEYLAGGGLTAMLALATHVGTFPIRLAEKWSQHRAKKSEYDLQRTRNERLMLQEQALMIRSRANRLAVTEVEVLDPDDSSAPLVEIASREPDTKLGTDSPS